MATRASNARTPRGLPRGAARLPQLPSGSIDGHVHLFDPRRFPFNPEAPYTPTPAECGGVEALCSVLDAQGFAGALLVNPTSGYGEDNRCMLAALRSHSSRFRGIARVPLDVTHRQLQALARRGVVGIRIDLIGDGVTQLGDPRFVRRVHMLADLDLVMQVQCEGAQAQQLSAIAAHAPVRMVVDHCGRPDAALGVRQAGFRALLALADMSQVAIKLSGAFRFSRKGFPYADTDRYARALLAAFGARRCIWGSDWPFIRLAQRIDYGRTLATLMRWVPDARTRREILVTTPRRWFGFDR